MTQSVASVLFFYVCKVFCTEAGPSLDIHYKGGTYLRLLDKKKEWGSMSSPFITEPVALWEYLSLHTHRHKSAANTTTKHPYTPKCSQTVTAINGTEPSWELQILLQPKAVDKCYATIPHPWYTATAIIYIYILKSIWNNVLVAAYEWCGSVAFVYLLRLKHGCANHATEGKYFCPPSSAVT